mmetsp:Transcript_11336/g.19666  ORF Transcript_11336/g.19666 Transcript_11336/m.19666 type:complete len:242 (+) Transcript_11336:748-1473(+)
MQLPSTKQINGININRVHIGSIIRQHGRQRPSHNLGPINNRHRLPLHMPPNGLALIITRGTTLQKLHHTQRRTGQQTLFGIGRIIHVSDIPIQARSIFVTQSLHIALVRNGISKIIILTLSRERFDLSEDGIIHDNPMHAGIIVGIHQRRLDVDGIVDRAELVPDAIGATGPAGPFGVLLRGGIGVGEKADEEGSVDAGIFELLDLVADFFAEGFGDGAGVDFFGAGGVWLFGFLGCHGGF